MKIQNRFLIKELIILISFVPLSGCGVTSNPSSAGNGAGSVSSVSIQSMSPGDLARIQNQKAVALTPKTFDEQIQKLDDGDAVGALYAGLSDRDSAVRKKSEETLATLVSYDDRYLDELKKLQAENKNPDSWFSVSLILKDAEKVKAKAREAELKDYMRD
jgi:hypothetical protein